MNGRAAPVRRQAWRISPTLIAVPRDDWPATEHPPIAVWCSRSFLVQVYDEGNGIIRLSVNRTAAHHLTGWAQNITWDDLQKVKRQIGMGDRWAVEVYPADADVVNVANMRHLWVLPEAPAYGWRKAPQAALAEARPEAAPAARRQP